MIILKDECKKMGVSVSDFAIYSDTTPRTLRNWAVNHPKRLKAVINGFKYEKALVGDQHLQQDLI